MSHPVVLVDEDDQPVGTAEKLQAHTEGWLHRAFSVFIFDASGRLLLQQRTADKYHSGGLWSNACCSHPQPGEAPLDGAHRRLVEEMGFECTLTPAFRTTYRIPVDTELIEHEYDHVFVGTVDDPDVRPSPEEVADWRWMQASALRDDVAARPGRYTAWFRLLLDQAVAAAPLLSETDPSPLDDGS